MLRRRGIGVLNRAGSWGRRMPPSLRRRGREVIEALPEVRFVRGAKRVLLSPAMTAAIEAAALQLHPRAARRMIPLAMAGDTYSPEEIATFLQMEAALLRERLFELTQGLPASTSILDDQPSVQTPQAAARDDRERHLADEYLAAERGVPVDDSSPVHLVILNVYPRVGAEYGNGFVHRRIKYYQEAGARVQVAVVAPDAEPEIYSYDGVRVIGGVGAGVQHLLDSVRYTSVSVHSLSPHMWDQIEHHLEGQRLFCFLHGFESRRWIRTLHNYRDSAAIHAALADTLQRQRLWRRVLAHPVGAAGFIFVSHWWRQAAQEDMELVFPGSRSHVVPNLVEPAIFRYVPKDADQRFRILWVRSANNLNYGSDLAVQVIQRLLDSRHGHRLSVTVWGDGRHFGAFEEAFSGVPQVHVERKFATQEQIAELHRDHGIFLVPSRLDSQGVSRDEAMSSGLVPVTNRVAAVGEFVDDTCSILAPPEDVDAMVRGVLKLMDSPDEFQRMSEAAGRRAQAQAGPAASVHREMELMGLSQGRRR